MLYYRNKQFGEKTWRYFPSGYEIVAGSFVSRRSRIQTNRTDKWPYQSIRSDKDLAIDRHFPYRPPPSPVTFVPLRLMDNYQHRGPSSITILDTLGPLIGDFVFSRDSVKICFRHLVYDNCFVKKFDYFSLKPLI